MAAVAWQPSTSLQPLDEGLDQGDQCVHRLLRRTAAVGVFLLTRLTFLANLSLAVGDVTFGHVKG